MDTGNADISKVHFHSGANYLKRSEFCGNTTLNTATTTTHTVTHNLGYIPFYQVYAELDEAGTIWTGGKVSELSEQGFLSGLGAPPTYIEIDSWITTTQLTIRLSNTASQQVPIYWLIYLDYGNA